MGRVGRDDEAGAHLAWLANSQLLVGVSPLRFVAGVRQLRMINLPHPRRRALDDRRGARARRKLSSSVVATRCLHPEGGPREHAFGVLRGALAAQAVTLLVHMRQELAKRAPQLIGGKVAVCCGDRLQRLRVCAQMFPSVFIGKSNQ